MPVYFDPSQMTNAFAQGAQIGGGIRKNQTQSKLAPMIASGDYKGANAFAASRGDLEMMDYLRPMAKEAEDADFNKRFGGMLATGDAKGAAAMGFADGRIEQGMGATEYGRTLKTQGQEDYLAGLKDLHDNAGRIMELAEEDPRRGQMALEIVQASPYKDNPEFMAAVQQAVSDGRLSNGEIQSFRMKLMSVGEQYQREQDAKVFDYGAGQDKQAQSNWERQFAADKAAREAAATSAGKYGVTPIYGRDANGNRVLLQANNAGGVNQADLPEGVTLEDDYSRAFDRTSGTEAAKKAAYESTAGRALTAFETKADLLLDQIDTAISQTSSMNTGLIGQLVAAGDLDGTLDAIGAKAMLSELIAIKDQGGTMGALSDSEGAALRNAAVNVARSQREDQLDANLRTYRLQVEKTRMAMRKAFEDEYVNGPNAVRGPSPAAPANGRVGPSGQPVPEGFE